MSTDQQFSARNGASLKLLVVLIWMTGPLGAAEPAKPGRFKVGPAYLTPRVVLKNAGIDTNVFNSETNPISDKTVVLSPTLDAALPVGGRLRTFVTGWVDLTWYGLESSEGGTDGGGHARGELTVNRFTLFGEGSASAAKQRFSPDLDLRVRRREHSAAIGLTTTITSRFSFGASYRSAAVRYDSALVEGADVRGQLDRDSRVIQGELRFALTSLTSLVFSGDDVEDIFVSQPAGSASAIARSRRYLVGFELGPRALFTGRALVGRRSYPADSTAVPQYAGLALAISATAPLNADARLAVNADRDVHYSAIPILTPDGTVRNSYLWDRYGAQVEIDLPLKLIARGQLAFDRTGYALPSMDSGVVKRRVDKMWTLGASVLRRFGSSLRLGINISHQERSSNFAGSSLSALRYGLQGELSP